MLSQDMLLPGLAMAGLTFVVWIRMYIERIGQMQRLRIHPQSVASSAQMAAAIKDTRAVDNFRNLFELPVLFYLAIVVAIISGQVTGISLALAWVFVVLRVAHSFIHCSYNKVMHRFKVYIASGMALFSLWAYLAFGLLG